MKRPTAASALVMAGVIAAQDYNSPPPDLSTLPELSLFETWRPKVHVLPPTGDMGHPCMHYSCPDTGMFHIGYVQNDTGIANIKTHNLIHLYEMNENGNYSIVPGGPNDPVALSDGSVIPRGVDGERTLLYTGISELPIHWTLPYTRGSESQSIAVTYDAARSFTKSDIPPVIPGPPEGVDVTGFSDPFAFQSGKFDQALDSPEGTWYSAISGSIRDNGPSTFLYRNKNRDFDDWEYIGVLFNEPANSTWGSGDWARIWGFNWEDVNVFSIDGTGWSHGGDIFMTIGVEGSDSPIQEGVTSTHDALWAAGDLSIEDGGVTFNLNMVGVFDWGSSAYAAAGTVMPYNSSASSISRSPDRFLSFVWLTGDEYGAASDFPRAQQGWQSTLLLPRELTVKTISSVVNNDLVKDKASWRVTSEGQCVELQTLGIDIAREPYESMTSFGHYTEPDRKLTGSDTVAFDKSPETKFFVLNAKVSFPKSARGSDLQSGFQILSSEHESTTVYYQFSNESIIVNRNNTSAAAKTTGGIDSSPESGRLRLFDISDSCDSDDGEIETLDLTIVVDNGVLEVYANSRFALSTWTR